MLPTDLAKKKEKLLLQFTQLCALSCTTPSCFFSCHSATLNFWNLLLQCQNNLMRTLTPYFFPFTTTPPFTGFMITQITVQMLSFVSGNSSEGRLSEVLWRNSQNYQ